MEIGVVAIQPCEGRCGHSFVVESARQVGKRVSHLSAGSAFLFQADLVAANMVDLLAGSLLSIVDRR